MSEGLQRRNWGQDVTKADGLSQQPQPDNRTSPPEHLHGSLFTAALKAHTIHLRDEMRKLNIQLLTEVNGGHTLIICRVINIAVNKVCALIWPYI